MSLQERMQKLKATFVGKLPDYLLKIERAYEGIKSNDDSRLESGLQEMFIQYHSVKGAAATFGYKTLSDVAKSAESHMSLTRDMAKKEGRSENTQRELQIVEKNLAAFRIAVQFTQVDQSPDHITTRHTPLSNIDLEISDERSKKLIFICDDDPSSVEHLKLQLSHLGYDVRPFTSTESLFKAVQKETPIAMIIDISFPEDQSSGPEIVQHLRDKMELLPPVIFISSRSDFHARLESVQAGGDAYFLKPLKTIELVQTLDTLTATEVVEPYKVLVLDDDPEVNAYHSAVLQDVGMVTYELLDPEKILEVLEDFHPDLILLDMYMPPYTGREVSKIIRQMPDHISLPIIYLSSEQDISKQAMALEAGAEGFLTKPINPEILVTEVNVRVDRMRSLKSMMVRDSLTHLFNHTYVRRHAETTYANSLRNNRPFAVAMIDIDHFKTINDTYGHPTGDKVLIAISRLLKQNVRQGDVVGRYGGEEFVIILNDINEEHAQFVMQNIHASFAKLEFHASEQSFNCTFSGGIALSPYYYDASEMIEYADQALYHSKQNGRNQLTMAKRVR